MALFWCAALLLLAQTLAEHGEQLDADLRVLLEGGAEIPDRNQNRMRMLGRDDLGRARQIVEQRELTKH